MPVTRRDLNLLLPLLAASAARAQEKQVKKVLPSAAFKFDELPVKFGPLNTCNGRYVDACGITTVPAAPCWTTRQFTSATDEAPLILI